jgi:hypothetical protein
MSPYGHTLIKKSSNITFVTTFMNIYEKPYASKDLTWRFEKFFEIVETGIQLCVYVDSSGKEMLDEYQQLFGNIKFMKIVNLEDTWIHEICHKYNDITLPDNRNTEKDIFKYILLMNSKIEFMKDAIEKNPWNSTHFAWIDFNIAHIFKDMAKSKKQLMLLAQADFKPKLLVIPGCYSPAPKPMSEEFLTKSILNNIHWRFCGGFFMGDKQSIMEFYYYYETFFPTFVDKYRKLIWEVNFWSWLESETDWKPRWYCGDHNDSMIYIPLDCYTHSLTSSPSCKLITYNYPTYEGFYPGSASFINFNRINILNTRYTNYTLTPTGYYIFNDPSHKITTRNFVNVLSNDFTEINEREKIHEIMDPTDIECFNESKFSGVEDIRIYKINTTLRFIATSINFSKTGRNSMVVGDYDLQKFKCMNNRIVSPPIGFESCCEKNWSPVIRKTTETGENLLIEEEWFIYSWSPMRIGTIDDTENRLVIKKTIDMLKTDIFTRFRGSTPFIEWGEFMIGVVHFSESDSPRHYYHCLIMLNANTLKPVKMSRIFFFEKIGIEFCIGFTIKDMKWHFWISRFDRDPAYINIDILDLPINIEIE